MRLDEQGRLGAYNQYQTAIGQPNVRVRRPPARQPTFDFGNMFGGSGGGGNQTIGTSINPRPMFDSGQTQRAINQLAAAEVMPADPNFAMKRFTRPGMSRDAGTLAAATPSIARGVVGMQRAQAAQPLMDELANRNFMLQQQNQQGQEGLGLFDLLRRQQQIGDYRNSQMISPLLQALLQGVR